MLTLPELRELAARRGALVVDGGLATELESRGCDISGTLWSAQVLLDQPEAIEQLHFDYLQAGADVIITSSYQLSYEGLKQISRERDCDALLLKSLQLAASARERHLKAGGRRPLIAASIGPYGAALADGSEYHGNYGVDDARLAEFHRGRLKALAAANIADLFACETVPSLAEARVLAALMAEIPGASGWITFSCRDDAHTCRGEAIGDCACVLEASPHVIALGVNCTAPEHIEGLVRRMAATSSKPIVVYPNSGEVWDAAQRRWKGHSHVNDFAALAAKWKAAGATLIGGCCRTGPGHIAALSAATKA